MSRMVCEFLCITSQVLPRPTKSNVSIESIRWPIDARANCTVKGRISMLIGHEECYMVHLPYPLNQSRLEGPCSDHQMQQSVASFVAAMHLENNKKDLKKEREMRGEEKREGEEREEREKRERKERREREEREREREIKKKTNKDKRR